MFKSVKSKNVSRLGALLLKKGKIDQSQLKQALQHQKKHQLLLGQSLVALGLIDNQELQQILHRQKWLRSIFASFVLASVPVCPVLASEKKLAPAVNQTAQVAHNGLSEKSIATSQKAINQNFYTPSDLTNYFSHPFYQGLHSNHNYALTLEASRKARIINDESSDGFLLGVNYNFSRKSGVQLGITKPNLEHQMTGVSPESTYVAQVAFYTSTQSNQEASRQITLTNSEQLSKQQNSKLKRFDRYKNTIPAVYSLTLKGYSLLETSANQIETLSLQKHKDSPYRKYELMFSVTKRF